MKQTLLPLMAALYFSGAQTSGTTVPPVPWVAVDKGRGKKFRL